MVVFPNAKINIGLDIVRKRDDGYHDIVTVMVPVPWTDILEIVPSKGDADTLNVSGREVNCPPENNLVMKAVKALRRHVDFPPVDLYLHKIIPDGAGLGGGSADAAFALVAINDLFDLGLEKPMMAEVASLLGADCPFFVYDRPMICRGTGTEMEDFDLTIPADLTLVIVKPAVSVPTKAAYAAVVPAMPSIDLAERLTSVPFDQWQQCVGNDFERSVFPAYPEIGLVKTRLLDMGAVYAAMSGSGSSVFGFFDHAIMSDEIGQVFAGCDILVRKF